MQLKLILTIGLCALYTSTFAQLNLPEDEQKAAKARSNYALITDNVKSKDYNTARKPLQWVVANTPDLHESVYVHGVNIYNSLEEEATGEKKSIFQDSILALYDLRVQYFNAKENVADRKATTAYKFYKDDTDKFGYLLEVFDKTFELNGTEVSLSNLAAYMDVVYKNDSINTMTNDAILTRYDKVMAALETKEGDDIGKVRGAATNLLAKTMGDSFNCEFIKTEMAPKMNNDPAVAKRIITLSLAKGCTTEDFFADAAKIIIDKKPDYGLVRVVAGKAVEKGNYDEAMGYYQKALESTSDKEKQAKVYVDMAKLYQVKNDNAKAVENIQKALEIDPEMSKAYKIMGDLYFNSFETCRQNKNIVKDRAVFLVAYDMYAKAGDKESMANARAQFPSISEIFEQNYEEGDPIKVNCWINKTTTLRRRPE